MMSLTELFFNIGSKLNITSVLIGGLALPAYNVGRTTLDIDIAIYVESQKKLNRLVETLSKYGIQTQQNPKINHDLFTIYGKKNEAEIWLKPCDKFGWDQKMRDRTFYIEKNIRVLSIEDFILTKLARSDRTSIDIDDIIQILIANSDSIDWDYLNYRIAWANVKKDFEKLLEEFSQKAISEYQDIANNILKQYQKSKQNQSFE